jgi:hypothetical protein
LIRGGVVVDKDAAITVLGCGPEPFWTQAALDLAKPSCQPNRTTSSARTGGLATKITTKLSTVLHLRPVLTQTALIQRQAPQLMESSTTYGPICCRLDLSTETPDLPILRNHGFREIFPSAIDMSADFHTRATGGDRAGDRSEVGAEMMVAAGMGSPGSVSEALRVAIFLLPYLLAMNLRALQREHLYLFT